MANYSPEAATLIDLLDEAGISYELDEEEDLLWMTYALSERELLEDGYEVDVLGTWREGLITLSIGLLDLEEDVEESEPETEDIPDLDPNLMGLLLRYNYELDICKYALDENQSIWLLIDLDTENLQVDTIRSGIQTLFDGFDTYLELLQEWYAGAETQKTVEQRRLAKSSLIGAAKFGVKETVLVGMAAAAGVTTQGVTGILEAAGRSE
ncbi:MAG: hypothetical protein ACO4AI_01065 [Prochlorothrix sp.]|nr:hypothetical protein [Prochlorothrix sp.]